MTGGPDVDAREFVRLIEQLGAAATSRSLRAGLMKSARTVQKGVVAALRQRVDINPAGHRGFDRKTGYRTVWRRLDKDVNAFLWRRGAPLGATVGLLHRRATADRAWILRLLDQGTAARYTKGGARVIKKRAYRGSIGGRDFFQAGVSATWKQATEQLGLYTLEALRKAASRL